MAAQDPKISIVVGRALYKPWLEILHEGQLKTWAFNPSPYTSDTVLPLQYLHLFEK